MPDRSDYNNPQTGNIFSAIPESIPAELFETILQRQQIRIERIVSKGHATPENTWYDQNCDEWVLLIQGNAALLFENDSRAIEMCRGQYVWIPAHRKHRVIWTDPEQETIWLAIYFAGENIAVDPC